MDGQYESKQEWWPRQNRTITLHLCNRLEEYEEMYLKEYGTARLLNRVEIVDSLEWGRLGDGLQENCVRLLNFTYHGGYIRMVKHFDGGKSPVTVDRSSVGTPRAARGRAH